MSFAVIQTGGKQYKVKAGEILKIEKFPDGQPNSKIEFKEILAYGDDKSIELGNPVVSGAKVEAELLKNSPSVPPEYVTPLSEENQNRCPLHK